MNTASKDVVAIYLLIKNMIIIIIWKKENYLRLLLTKYLSSTTYFLLRKKKMLSIFLLVASLSVELSCGDDDALKIIFEIKGKPDGGNKISSASRSCKWSQNQKPARTWNFFSGKFTYASMDEMKFQVRVRAWVIERCYYFIFFFLLNIHTMTIYDICILLS